MQDMDVTELLLERVVETARIAHEISRAYCQALGDDSQSEWETAPDWQRQSVIRGVFAHLEADLTPEQSHEKWLEEKQAEGWVYGEVKDPVAKTHPCMVSFKQLPVEQRVKDHLFKAVVENTLIALYEREADLADDPDVEIINLLKPGVL